MREATELYIGPNPDTGELEIDKIQEILSSRHDRYIVKGVFDGYWRGYPEDTFIVLVFDLEEIISETIEILAKKLNRATIAVMSADDLKLM